MDRYTDLAYARDDAGDYDLVLDTATGDLSLTSGLESALFISLFSDRRARADEVADALRRRGWIGNLMAEVPGDNHGSGLWLYEQRRLTGEVVAGVRLEAEQALEWLAQEGLVRTASARVVPDPANRRITLLIDLTEPGGGASSRAFELADATRQGALVRI